MRKFKVFEMKYSVIPSVVDDSEFRPDSELVRSAKFSPSGGDGSTPLYDYPDGKVPENDKVSSLVLKIRSGKLDKADVEKVKEAIFESAKYDTEKAENAALKQAVKNTLLGIDSNNNNSN